MKVRSVKRKRRIWLTAALLFLGVIAASGASKPGIPASEQTARAYVDALLTLDFDRARSLAVGEGLVGIEAVESSPHIAPAHAVAAAWATKQQRNWAQARVKIETLSTTGERDLVWLGLELIRLEGTWWVTRFRPLQPGTGYGRAGMSTWWKTQIPPEAELVLSEFLVQVVADPSQLRPWLSGPAHQAWQQQLPLLGEGRLYREVGPPSWQWVAWEGDLLRVQGHYQLDGRPVQTLFTLAQRVDGVWQIVEVSNLGRL